MANSREQELQQELDRRSELENELSRRNQSNVFPLIKNNDQDKTLSQLIPGINDPRQLGMGAIQTGGVLGSMLAPEVPAIMSGATMLPKAVNALAKIAPQGIFGAMSSPEHPIVGGAVGALAPGAFKLGGKALSALHPANLFRGNQSKQELINALNVTQGTETPLGDVLQSPFLKHTYENVIAKVPFSGANEAMQRTGRQIIDKGQGIMANLLGKHSPADVEGQLHDTLVAANKFHRNLKTQLYNEPDKISQNIGLKLELPQFSNLAKNYSGAIQETNILKTEPEVKSLLNRLQRYEEPTKEITGKILDVEGKPIVSSIKYPTLKEANILSSHLDDIAERYAQSGNTADRNLSPVFRRLSQALKKDVKNGVNNSGNKKLIDSFNKAEANYAKNYSPYLEKEIYKVASNKNFDPDLIVQSFIKTGKTTDRANLLEKFVSKLPESKRKLLGYAFLKRAYNNKGELDPLAFKQLISSKSLGPRQFDLLFPGKLGKELKNYSELIEKNPEAFQVMRNPKTGARLGDLAAIAGLVTNPFLAGGAMLGARGINKLLTSPTIREKLIAKMIK